MNSEQIEEFLMQHPYLLRWVNECQSCRRRGCKLEMPELGVDNSVVIRAKLRRLFDELALDEDGLCQQCRQARLAENS